jgi:iron complex transport system ATP-binding protein
MEQLRQEKGITVIMVSHDLNLAAMYGNHILLMTDGKVQKQGPPGEVLTETELQKSYGCRILVDTYPLGAEGVRLSLVPGKYVNTV